MSLWSRIANEFRSRRLRREIDEELQAHLAEAVEHALIDEIESITADQ